MKIILPIVVLLLAVGMAAGMYFLRPEPASQQPEIVPTPVSAMNAEEETVLLQVHSQGTVSPLSEATVAAQVGGEILEASENLKAGRFVERGEILVKVDPTDYEAAVAEAEAALRSARTSLLQTEADAEQAIEDLRQVGVENPTPLARREPQLEQARLRVKSAEAGLELARKNLERTVIRSPFEGQVVETFVDLGDTLPNRGSPVARIQGTAIAEVRLPLSREDLRHLDLPDTPAEVAEAPAAKPAVDLLLGQGAARVRRTGWIDRLEGTTDPVTRLRHAVARVEDPLDGEGTGEQALPTGSFVQARIEGREIPSAFRIPIIALVGKDRVRIINAENELEERQVTVVQRNGDNMVVTDGIRNGDRICLTPLEIFIPNMPVRIAGDESEAEGDRPEESQ